MKEKIKIGAGIVSFICSLVIGFMALFLPPKGVIDSTVLWFIAQMLLFTSNIFGFKLDVSKADKVIQPNKQDK